MRQIICGTLSLLVGMGLSFPSQADDSIDVESITELNRSLEDQGKISKDLGVHPNQNRALTKSQQQKLKDFVSATLKGSLSEGETKDALGEISGPQSGTK